MVLETVRVVGFGVCGVFTVALGLVHFTMPRLFDFDGAIPNEGEPLRPLNLGPISYRTKRSDVRGIAQIMNHAVSYALVTIGVVDLLVERWYTAGFAPYLLAWLAGWWFLRAVTQRHMGGRTGDWLVAAGFTLLGCFHLVFAVLAYP